jgi:hypothetical protein
VPACVPRLAKFRCPSGKLRGLGELVVVLAR